MIQILLHNLKMDPLVSLHYYAPVCAAINLCLLPFTEGLEPFYALSQVGAFTLICNAAVAFLLNIAAVFLVGVGSGLVLTLAGVFKVRWRFLCCFYPTSFSAAAYKFSCHNPLEGWPGFASSAAVTSAWPDRLPPVEECVNVPARIRRAAVCHSHASRCTNMLWTSSQSDGPSQSLETSFLFSCLGSFFSPSNLLSFEPKCGC